MRKNDPTVFEEKRSELFNYSSSSSFSPSPSSSSSSSSSSPSSRLSFENLYRTTIRINRGLSINGDNSGAGSANQISTICMSTSTTDFYSITSPHAQQTAPFTDSLNCYLLHLSSHYVTFQNNVAVPKPNAQPREFFVFSLMKDIIRGIQSLHAKHSPSPAASPTPVIDLLSPHSIVISPAPAYAVLLPVYTPRRAIAATAHRSYGAATFLALLAEYARTVVNSPGNTSAATEGLGPICINNPAIDEGFTYIAGGYETLRYCPPECLEGSPPSMPSIVYSLCMILYSYIAGQPPFANIPIQNCVTNILQGGRPSLDVLNGSPFQSFFTRCWAKQSADRPSLGEMFSIVERMENEF